MLNLFDDELYYEDIDDNFIVPYNPNLIEEDPVYKPMKIEWLDIPDDIDEEDFYSNYFKYD